jgi:hypothetical protein
MRKGWKMNDKKSESVIGCQMAPMQNYRPGYACGDASGEVQNLIFCTGCGELYACEEHGKCNVSKCPKTRNTCLSGKFTSVYAEICWKCIAKKKHNSHN